MSPQTGHAVPYVWLDLVISPVAWSVATLAILLTALYHRSKSHPTPTTKPVPAAVPPRKMQSRIVTYDPRTAPDIKVSKILLHPIKSCRGTAVQSVPYSPEGLENDRKWCISDVATNVVLTARELPKMVLVSPVISPDPTSPHKGSLIVNFPPESGCESFSVPLQPTEEYLKNWQILPNITLWTSDMDAYICQSEPPTARTPSEILSAYFGKSVYLLYKGPRPRPVDPTTDFPELQATAVFQDGYPLLVLSEESMSRVEEEIKPRVGTMGVREAWKDAKVPIERFRPNIVIKGGGPFAEDMWEEIAIGSETAPGITLVSKCARCLLPNVSPDTGERDPAVPYKILMKFRTGIDPADKMKPCVGCNAVPAASGVVSVGDVVIVRRQFV